MTDGSSDAYRDQYRKEESELAAKAGIKVSKIDDGSSRITLEVKGVLFYDDEGHYLLHASDDKTPEKMFELARSIWDLSPDTEQVRYVEMQLSVPKISTLPKVRVYHK